jgi:hypothetical protein
MSIQSRAQGKAFKELKDRHPEEYREFYTKWCIELGSIPQASRLEAMKLLKENAK